MRRVLSAHPDPEFHVQLRLGLTGDSEAADGPADDPVGGPVGDLAKDLDSRLERARGACLPGVDFELQAARGGRDAVAAIGRAIDCGQPISVVFLEGSRTSRWDGVDVLTRLWRVDPRLEVALCAPADRLTENDGGFADAIEEIGDSDQLLLVDPPYRPAKMRQIAQSLVRKWHLARLAERARRTTVEQSKNGSPAESVEAPQSRGLLDRQMVERARVEGDLRKAQRLAALGRLAAGLGHEINNPLAFMISGAEGALEELVEAERRHPHYRFQSLRELLDTIVVGADRIRTIVKNIKLLAHQAENTAESVDLSAALEVALTMVAGKLESGVALITDIDDVAPIWCKRIELEQVFINLLDNAIHAVTSVPDRAGRVQVACRQQSKDTALVEVNDNGPGIPRATLDKVFDPFFTTKPAGVGTGLGLSICHGIVTALGGRIDIDSTLGSGTRVSVHLPCLVFPTDEHTRETTAPPKPSQPSLKPPIGASKGRVLVVDDEPLIRRVVKHALHAHEVITATNGREALEQCRAQEFDVILCDIMMPELNGVEFYRMLSDICPGAEDDIIFFSGGTQIDEIHAFLDEVPNECLEKPVQRRRLQQRVNQYVREKRALKVR